MCFDLIFDAMDDFIGETWRVCEMRCQTPAKSLTLCRLRFSVVLNYRDCLQQGLCMLDIAKELQKAKLMVLEYVKSYLRALCASCFPSCDL